MTLEIGIPLLALGIFSLAAGLGLCAGWALRPKNKPCAGDCVRRSARSAEPPRHPACVDCTRATVDPEASNLLKCEGTYDPVTGEPGYFHCGDERRGDGCGLTGRYFKARRPEIEMTVRDGLQSIDGDRSEVAPLAGSRSFDKMRDENNAHHKEVRERIAAGRVATGKPHPDGPPL